MQTKFCPRCATTLPVAAFYADRHRYDGLSSYCGACKKASVRASRANLTDEQREARNAAQRARAAGYAARFAPAARYAANYAPVAPLSRKHCPACERKMGAHRFYTDAAAPSGLSTYCRDCTKAKRRARYQPCTSSQPSAEPVATST